MFDITIGNARYSREHKMEIDFDEFVL